MPPKRNRGRAPAPQYLELITDHATNEDHAAGADGDEDRSNLNAIDTGKYDNLTEEEELARCVRKLSGLRQIVVLLV